MRSKHVVSAFSGQDDAGFEVTVRNIPKLERGGPHSAATTHRTLRRFTEQLLLATDCDHVVLPKAEVPDDEVLPLGLVSFDNAGVTKRHRYRIGVASLACSLGGERQQSRGITSARKHDIHATPGDPVQEVGEDRSRIRLRWRELRRRRTPDSKRDRRLDHRQTLKAIVLHV
jgi:hypothetical protein